MTICDLATLRAFFRECIKTPVFGVGVYAFDRLGLESVVCPYRLLALRYSLDTCLIENDFEVLSLEKDMGTKHLPAPRNSTTVLLHPRVKEYLARFKNPALVVYKSSSKIEEVCRANNWTLVAQPIKFGKKLLEDKVKFRRILKGIGCAPPPGEILHARDLDFSTLQKKYGLPFVVQHPRRGGGKGTFFIHNTDDWQRALKKLRVQEKEGEEIAEDISRLEVIVAKFIQGPSPSITGCVTRYGVLSTSPQYQLIDIPELYNPQKGSGLFCGHDWSSSRFSPSVERQAYDAVQKVGAYFKQIGYKGIFGLDFILEKQTQRLYIVECNPRLLGSFPTLTMAQTLNNEPPIIAFHLLEYLGVDYEVDIENINNLMRQPKMGAQMFLHNLTGRWTRSNGGVSAGIYTMRANKLIFLRPGYDLKHLGSNDEFLLADGVLQKGAHFSPNRRLGRIITLRAVLDENKKALAPWAKQAATLMYDAFSLKKIRFAKIRKFFNPDFLAKG